MTYKEREAMVVAIATMRGHYVTGYYMDTGGSPCYYITQTNRIFRVTIYPTHIESLSNEDQTIAVDHVDLVPARVLIQWLAEAVLDDRTHNRASSSTEDH